MPIQRMNHAVLYVRDVERTAGFYKDVLGFRTVFEMPGQAAFLQAPDSTNDHDLGLFQMGDNALSSAAGQTSVGLYHLAWEVDTLDELERLGRRLGEHKALVGASDHGTTKSIYAKDPDGCEFEICWLIPADQITDDDRRSKAPRPLDLAKEMRRFGPDVQGGVGVSHPALT